MPNYLTLPGILIGLALAAFAGWGVPGLGGLLDHVVATGAAFLLCYPMYALGWMKAGDVKLLMAVGALRGTSFLLAAGLYGSLLGGLLAIVLIVSRRLIPPEHPQRGGVRTVLKSSIPYGVALGAGGLVALLLDVAGA
ncbi:MAG: prepilin peptidase [Chloroflexota bacterium]|nr:prepilin peptidase [Chloroflexota bacterium]HEV8054542.1 prepilin peptidase [Candidatus Limnocylindrales bacterium]